ncbi:MAG: hypothetical protein ACK47B_08705 [Armatimonadota bacterium]
MENIERSREVAGQILTECRGAFGSAPRKFGLFDRLGYLSSNRPAWCGPSDSLSSCFVGRDELLREGTVVWGHIIQGNPLLFKPGPQDCAGEVLYCQDPDAEVAPSELGELAQVLFRLKGREHPDPALTHFSRHLEEEPTRVFGLDVPPVLCGELRYAVSTVFFDRKHLPNRMLSAPFFPLVVSPGSLQIAAILPSRFWPPVFTDYWRRAALVTT